MPADDTPQQINLMPLTEALKSPCRDCGAAGQERSNCMEGCEKLSRFRGYLNGYHNFTRGCFLRHNNAAHPAH